MSSDRPGSLEPRGGTENRPQEAAEPGEPRQSSLRGLPPPVSAQAGGSPRPAGRIPPQDREAERTVLGAILLSGESIAEVVGLLRSEHFYDRRHAVIFETMLQLYERSAPRDLITVSAALQESGKLGGGLQPSFLAELTDRIASAANIAFHAKIVRDRALMRRLIEAATTICTSAYAQSSSIETLIDQAEEKIFEITSLKERRDFVPIKSVVADAFALIQTLYERNEPITGVPSGFAGFDAMTCGMQPSDLLIVAGRPSMGKTALALSIAKNVAVDHKQAAAVFSLEMSKEQLVMRMLCAEARINGQRLRAGEARDYEWPRLARAAQGLTDAPLYIDDSGSLSILEMRAKARRLQAEHGLGLIVVDYLQLMRGRGGGQEGREREISEISRGLKALAKELAVPVMALSQLNRSLEQRGDKRPQLSDLRESGAIEQDADVIAFVYRDEYYHSDTQDRGIAELIIGKQRNGPTGTVRLKFNREWTRFDDEAPAEA